MAHDTNNPLYRLAESEKIRLVDEVINDPRYPRPPTGLTKEDKLELFAELVKAGAINRFDRIPASERIRIVDELLVRADCPIPQKVARSLPKEAKLELFEKLVEGGAIKFTPPSAY